MATRTTGGASAPPNLPCFPTVAPDQHARRILRSSLTAAIAELVDLLDQLDGDPDLGPDGDELDGTGAEDDFCDHNAGGPGCPASDPGEDDDPAGGAVDDEGEQVNEGGEGWHGIDQRDLLTP